MEYITEHFLQPLQAFVPKLVKGAIIVFVGYIIYRLLMRWVNKGLSKKLDKTTNAFIRSTLKIVIWVVVFLMAAGSLGLDTGSLVAVIASAGVAIGLALKDSLSNIASGIIIIMGNNYKSGDFIEIEGSAGSIDSVDLIYTTINSSDNKRIIVPNSVLAGNIVTNYSHNDLRRVELNFGISYTDSIAKAKEIIHKVIKMAPGALEEPAPLVEVMSYENSSVRLVVRIWCKKEEYWNIYFFVNEQVKLAFDREGITIPFNQLDINIKGDN